MILSFFSLRFLKIRRKNGLLIIVTDLIIIIPISLALSSMFHFIERVNFFSTDGFVDRIGSLSSTLTGFYIAGLLAVATFAMPGASIDDRIEVGQAFFGRPHDIGRKQLTRREYVLCLFGYLAVASLMVAVFSAVSSGMSSAISNLLMSKQIRTPYTVINFWGFVSFFSKFIFNLAVLHILKTTGVGLYYLSYKIYDKTPEIKSAKFKSDEEPK